jgi:hypothetical protein
VASRQEGLTAAAPPISQRCFGVRLTVGRSVYARRNVGPNPAPRTTKLAGPTALERCRSLTINPGIAPRADDQIRIYALEGVFSRVGRAWTIGDLIDAALATQSIKPVPTAPDRRKRFTVIDGGKN